MKLHSKILKNTFSIFFVRIASPVVTFILLMVISRMLGPETLGKYSTLIAFLQISQFIPLLGLHTYLIREIAKDHSLVTSYVSNSLVVGGVSSFILATGLYMVSLLLGYPHDMMTAIWIVCLTILPNAMILTFEAAIAGHERMEFIALVIGIENILKVVFSLIVLYFGGNITNLIAVLLIFRVCALVAYFFVLRRIHGPFSIFCFDIAIIKHLYKISPVFLGIVIFSSFINRIDIIVLSKLRTFAEVGLYTVAYRTFEIGILFSTAFLIAIFPTMSRLHKESKEQLVLITEKSILHLTQIVVLLSAGIFIFADDFIIMFFSESYLDSIMVLRLLITTVVVVALDQVLAGLLIASNCQIIDLKVVFCGLVSYILLLLLLVPWFGINGAAIATLSATSIQFAIRTYFTKKNLMDIRIWRNVWRSIIAGICTIFTSLILLKFYWIIAIPFVCFIYVCFLFLFGSVSKNEILFLLNKVKSREFHENTSH